MESKKINQLATELTPALSDLTIIGDPTTGISKKITLSQMASLFTGTVEEYANLAAFPLVGTADTIYIALDTNILYRWDTTLTSYVELSPNIVTSLVFNDANGFDGTISLVGSTATLTITTALTTGSIGFIGASGALTQDNSNFYWDNSNKRLGINTNAPTTALDVFGSGIIGRLNGTSTNNAFLGFASAGSNKWSIGNVQSDHRFRIYNEATTSELVSVLQTGEFGIGIANPTTKLHIDGGASALIANLDANVSVAKSISFRSDNSARINLEVSGTESGSNAGADLFIRTYTDAGSLLATPFYIKRSNGYIGINTTSPNVLLEVKGGSAMTTLANSYTNAGIIHQYNSTNILALGSNGSSMIIQGVNAGTNGAVPLLLQPFGGNVAIGTSTTNNILTLSQSNSAASTTIEIINSSNANATTKTAQLLFKLTDTANTIKDSGYVKSLPEGVNVLDAGLVFGTRNSDTTNDRMFLSSAGVLSLGGANSVLSTDKPHFFRMSGGGLGISANNEGSGNQPINFYTSGTLRAAITSGGTFQQTIPNSNDGLFHQISANSYTGYIYSYVVNNGGSYYLGVERSSGSGLCNGALTYSTVLTTNNSTHLTFGTNGVQRMMITPSGEVLMHSNSFNSANVGQLFGTGGDTYFTTDAQSTLYLNRKSSNGFLLIFQYNGSTTGTISTNANSLPSDKNFKKDISEISIGLNLINKLRPVHYRHKFDEDNEPLSNGIIAQEMEESLLECGIEKNSLLMLQNIPNEKEGESQYWVDYTKMIPVLIKAIQEQQTQIEELKALINK